MDLAAYCAELGRKARVAERALAAATGASKDLWLRRSAEALEKRAGDILEANAQDVEAARSAGLSAALIDRLRLTPERIRAAADSVRAVAALPDPVGRVLEGRTMPNGLNIQKITVPLGVILFIYESRPNVTVDAAALCVKSGNALILRGGKEAARSNAVLHGILAEELVHAGLPAEALQLVSIPDRDAVSHLLRLKQYIDLAIPRGGEGLIRRVEEEARMHILKHYNGNCHVYIDAAADLDMAQAITINAKCQRPGVCNAAETLLVHAAIAEPFLKRTGEALLARGVELRGCERTRQILGLERVWPATDEDYATEFLDLIFAVKVVDSLDEAIEHIARFGSGHTECIVTTDLRSAKRFTQAVDASAVMVNASTRFNDGYELGLGAEIGISTDKFHARGPCGLLELTCYKYVVQGEGHIRS